MTVEAKPSGLPTWLRVVIIGRRPRFTLVRVLILVAVVFSVTFFYLRPIRIEGPSMLPTYRSNQINLVNRLAYRWHEPQRGDVVSIRLAGPSLMYMKRIVGLPGETIEFSHGRLLVDGEPLEEPYVKFACHWNRPPQKLGPTEYFVVGDNREMRMEDHYFGAAQRDHIYGKIGL